MRDPRTTRTDADKLGRALASAGFETRIVGGAVRDLLLGIEPADYDLASVATPSEVATVCDQQGWRVRLTGPRHDTVTVRMGSESIEVSTLKGNGADDPFVEDALHRDLTVNAISRDLDGRIHDPFDGLDDLRTRTARFVVSAEDRLDEDPLRMLRWHRFRAVMGLAATEDDAAVVRRRAEELRYVAGERIRKEIFLTLEAGTDGIAMMRECEANGVAEAIDLRPSERWRVADACAGLGASAPAVLGVLLRSNCVVPFAHRCKASGAETRDMILASEIVADDDPSPAPWLLLLERGADAEVMQVVLRATGRVRAADAVMSGIPDFPVQGRDLIEAGIAPGVEIGHALKELREVWRASGYTAEGDDLLATLECRTARLPKP